MRCLAITVNGFRQTSSNKPMYSMDDLKGQKLRTPNIPHFIQMMDCLGVTSVPMAMSEIFNALETKVADGQENPYPTIYTSSFYEVQKYILESNHMFSPNFWIINEAFYQSLTDEQRALWILALRKPLLTTGISPSTQIMMRKPILRLLEIPLLLFRMRRLNSRCVMLWLPCMITSIKRTQALRSGLTWFVTIRPRTSLCRIFVNV